MRLVALYCPPVFLRSSVRVFALTCLIAIVSYGALPVTWTSLPSYFAVYVALIAVPSVRSPVVVCLTPPSDASLVMVRLLTGIGAGVYFDFSTLNFQVPSVLSAPKAATVVITKAMKALMRGLRILFGLLGRFRRTQRKWLSEESSVLFYVTD